jgi:ribosomal protein S10
MIQYRVEVQVHRIVDGEVKFTWADWKYITPSRRMAIRKARRIAKSLAEFATKDTKGRDTEFGE